VTDTMFPLRMFTPQGVAQFRESLHRIKANEITQLPPTLVNDPALTQIVDGEVYVEKRTFQTTLEMAQYLHPIIKAVRLANKFYNQGLWAWLSAFYFDVICPIQDGIRKPGEDVRHILSSQRWQDHSAHLIAAPVRVYDTHGDERTKLLLHGPPNHRALFLHLIMNSQELAMNPGILEAVTILYWDETTDGAKRGATTNGKPGTLWRFIALMNQLDVIYDLQAMNGEQIVSLLPKREFERWL
jgi:hypothetical protein